MYFICTFGKIFTINTDSLPTENLLINISNESHCVHCEIQIEMHQDV